MKTDTGSDLVPEMDGSSVKEPTKTGAGARFGVPTSQSMNLPTFKNLIDFANFPPCFNGPGHIPCVSGPYRILEV
ncbi:MAG: hypothetical protein JWM16_6134 [Verrucomicrobiales bacterium]|nr:hypothetical protein [Verrucomicrobiales bacterium]